MSHPHPPPPGNQPPPHAGAPQGWGQQPPSEPPPYGPGPQQWSPPPRKKSRAPKILMIIGGILLVAAIVLGLLFGRGIGSSIPGDDEITRIGTEATVNVEERLLLWQPSGTAVNCQVFGPTDEVPNVTYTGPDMSFTHNGTLYRAFGQIGADGDPMGEYQISCDTDGVIAAPPLNVGGLAGGIMGVVAGALLGGLGLILLIVGLILHFVSRNRQS